MITTLAAGKYAGRPAFIIENRRFWFHELDSLSDCVANGVVASGVSPGES
jgi:hypothetical protein